MTAILICALAVAVLVLGLLYCEAVKDRKKAEGETRACHEEAASLREEAEKSRKELEGVTPESLFRYLTEERGWQATYNSSDGIIAFSIGDESYRLRVDRLPQMHLSKGYRLGEDDVDWDDLVVASLRTSDELIMVKFNVWRGQAYDMYVTSFESTMGGVRQFFDNYVSVIEDAEKALAKHYNGIRDSRKAETQSPAQPQSMEEMAVKMAENMPAERKSVLS